MHVSSATSFDQFQSFSACAFIRNLLYTDKNPGNFLILPSVFACVQSAFRYYSVPTSKEGVISEKRKPPTSKKLSCKQTEGTNKDIRARINKARQSFTMLRPVWRERHLTLKAKMCIFNSNVKTALLHRSESWKRTKVPGQKLQVFLNKCLRQILNIWWPDRISNEERWQSTQQEPIMKIIKRRRSPLGGEQKATFAEQHRIAKDNAGKVAPTTPGGARWTQN